MNDNQDADLETEVETLKRERALLLDELESAYLRMEAQLLGSEHEREIPYQELRDRNAQLEFRLGELEKAHHELQETQRMLIRSERLAAMGEMAAAIVHEIKNPLTIILGRIGLVEYEGGVIGQKDLDVIGRAAEYLKGLADNVLRFARQHEGEARSTDLNQVIAGLEDFVKPIIRSVDLHLDLNRNIPRALADSGQAEQVLVNLIINAVDALQDGGEVTLRTGTGTVKDAVAAERAAGRPYMLAIETEEGASTGPYVFGEVRDNGPGIGERDLERIFETFFTTKPEGEGTGLGLSICRTIVGGWGGNILIASTKGQGVSSKVFLPATESGRATEPREPNDGV